MAKRFLPFRDVQAKTRATESVPGGMDQRGAELWPALGPRRRQDPGAGQVCPGGTNAGRQRPLPASTHSTGQSVPLPTPALTPETPAQIQSWGFGLTPCRERSSAEGTAKHRVVDSGSCISHGPWGRGLLSPTCIVLAALTSLVSLAFPLVQFQPHHHSLTCG